MAARAGRVDVDAATVRAPRKNVKNVMVAVRVRPLNRRELDAKDVECCTVGEGTVTLHSDGEPTTGKRGGRRKKRAPNGGGMLRRRIGTPVKRGTPSKVWLAHRPLPARTLAQHPTRSAPTPLPRTLPCLLGCV